MEQPISTLPERANIWEVITAHPGLLRVLSNIFHFPMVVMATLEAGGSAQPRRPQSPFQLHSSGVYHQQMSASVAQGMRLGVREAFNHASSQACFRAFSFSSDSGTCGF